VTGLSIAVVKDFELQWAKGYGVRDSRIGAPVTEETLFQAASITKSISFLPFSRLKEHSYAKKDLFKIREKPQ
jgi:CubicO group peptidase (beta-lactamase class C family)